MNKTDSSFLSRENNSGLTTINQKAKEDMQWYPPDSPIKINVKVTRYPGKVMATVLWHQKRIVLLESMPAFTTINSDSYVGTSSKLNAELLQR